MHIWLQGARRRRDPQKQPANCWRENSENLIKGRRLRPFLSRNLHHSPYPSAAFHTWGRCKQRFCFLFIFFEFIIIPTRTSASTRTPSYTQIYTQKTTHITCSPKTVLSSNHQLNACLSHSLDHLAALSFCSLSLFSSLSPSLTRYSSYT
jgi:hypothetical protein